MAVGNMWRTQYEENMKANKEARHENVKIYTMYILCNINEGCTITLYTSQYQDNKYFSPVHDIYDIYLYQKILYSV